MRLPVSWLREYVDFDDSPKGLAEKLTFSGTEVEGIETIGGTFEGIVVAEVREVRPHPNADRLTLCKVWTGREEIEVVCGAPNVKPGLKSPFAPVGVILPNGTQLKRAKIRGVESLGMLCAEDELGLSENHTGLVTLDGKIPAGTPLAQVFGPPETVLELEITPNRPDCLSVIGIAREVAALYGAKLKWPKEAEIRDQRSEVRFRVDVEDPMGCPRYTARLLENVQIAPAPDWMQKRLTRAGIRPINNVVDITNYVLLECGQPLHAFDQSLLHEGRIVVRRARPGERMTTLDGIERTLTSDLLVIADADRPVAVAGVMGGVGSEIRDTTQTVLLESACFNPAEIRAASRKLGLSSESSYRFERGVDISQVDGASRRAAALMVEFAGARVARGAIDVFPKPPPVRTVRCRFDRAQSLLGLTPSPVEIQKVFESLALPVIKSDDKSCTVQIPSFRNDLEREVDLIEEFARIHGLDKIPAAPPHAQIVAGTNDEQTRDIRSCREILAGLGLSEVVNYSLGVGTTS